MLWFWILTVAMILLGLWFVIPPLLSTKVTKSVENDELNIAIYRQKLTELDNEENLGEEQLKQARQELEQGLLQDVDSTTTATSPIVALQPRTQIMVGAIVAVIIPLCALLLYAELSPKQWTQLVEYNPAEVAKKKANLPSIDQMVGKLQARLQENPTDPKGWALLGRSYFVMGRYNEAANAYAQASKLSGEKDVDILADHAEALAMSQNGDLKGQATQIIASALATQPTHPKSLWLAGSAAFQAGQYKKAIGHWQSLLNMHPDKANEGAQVLQKQIAEARARLGDKAPAPVAKQPSTPDKDNKTEVKVSVSLDAKLKAKAAPNDTVFIFARAAQGPRMPLAIVKKQVKDLPITVSLNDAMAMMPNMKMSSFPKIYVGARVSKSGNATPQSGDLQGRSSPISTGQAQKVKVTISQEVY